MTSSLVGSEMCIRDRYSIPPGGPNETTPGRPVPQGRQGDPGALQMDNTCLLYTSDAADDM
eukprot:10622405-Prorocentrum_lima.AAC.1